MYDIAIIGGGVGGLVTASGAAKFGAKVALVEKGQLGGDCLNFGCVPTKSLVHSAKVFHNARLAHRQGLLKSEPLLNFSAVMHHMKEVQAKIAVHDSPERFRGMGIDVFLGQGEFKDANSFAVNGEIIKAKKFLISTGSRPSKLGIDGEDSVPLLNNENVLDLKEMPESLLIIGAGPIGVEYAQVMARFGCNVTLLQRSGKLLPKDDQQLAEILRQCIEEEGVSVVTVGSYSSVRQHDGGVELSAKMKDGKEKTFTASFMMLAASRTPNVESLNLDAIGVKYDSKGLKVNDKLQTSLPHIYGCGDVTGIAPFTHSAEYQAGIIISNALFPLINRRVDYSTMPWVTFSDPELAHAGLTKRAAVQKFGQVQEFNFSLAGFDRAVIDGGERGMVKLLCNSKGTVVGADVLAENGGELIHECNLAIAAGLHVSKLSQTIHPYPTLGQAVKRAADSYYTEKLFSGFMAMFTKFLFGEKK